MTPNVREQGSQSVRDAESKISKGLSKFRKAWLGKKWRDMDKEELIKELTIISFYCIFFAIACLLFLLREVYFR